MAACEAGLVEHLNADHADVVQLYARALLGRKGDGWRVIGVDPEGIDLQQGANHARLRFPTPVSDAAACVTIVCPPPIERVLDRGAPAGLGATV